MEALWIALILLSTAFLPSAVYILVKAILLPLRLWPWEIVTIEEGNRYRSIQRKDLW